MQACFIIMKFIPASCILVLQSREWEGLIYELSVQTVPAIVQYPSSPLIHVVLFGTLLCGCGSWKNESETQPHNTVPKCGVVIGLVTDKNSMN